MKVQFNCRIPKSLATKIRTDAVRANRSLDEIAATVFGEFFDGWTLTERANFYARTKAKKAGRRVSPSRVPTARGLSHAKAQGAA